MQDQTTRAAVSTAIAQYPSMTAAPFTLAGLAWHADTAAATLLCDLGERSMRPRQRSRLARFARTLAAHPLVTARTCVHAAKMLPTVRKALPWYTWPILGLAAIVKCFPLDMGTDEALFCVALLLVLWRRPGLLEALYREASSGKPAWCQCEPCSARWARRQARRAAVRRALSITARKAEAR